LKPKEARRMRADVNQFSLFGAFAEAAAAAMPSGQQIIK
jgi:hypothetical protein